MNTRLKKKIALAIFAAITCETLSFQMPIKAYGLNNKSQIIYLTDKQKELGGFELVSKKWINDLKCNACEYRHVKSGARLMFLDNKDDNKMFCVGFRTPTKDSTGVNHIIEHAVLQGSKKYPVKDPFIEMSKQSLNTFLNAFTAPDNTMYPVSSKNNKDFKNLMSIYLDAVFEPNVIKDKRIFKEQGWRYELESEKGELKYNGIVYNEMKGALSSPGSVLMNTVAESLFPDTCYKNESGGDPDKIPDLTYSEFVDTYKKYYTPSNSYFYLSGNLNIKETLKFIGENYLNNFDKKEVDSKIKFQKPFNERKIKTASYSVQKGTSIKNKTYLSSNYVIDKATNKDSVIGCMLLQMLLTGTPSSPITKAMIKNGFGENISAQCNPQYFQPVFSIIGDNLNEDQKEKFQKVIDDTLKDIVKNGFDKELLNSVLNQFELYNRTIKGNNPLTYNQLIMRSWLYDGDPTMYLNINLDINKIKEKINKGELEGLIQKYFLDNKHTSLVVLKPSQGLEEKREGLLKKKLASIKKSLSKDKMNSIIKETKELKMWQDAGNTKEALKCLPSLSRDDIDKKAKEYETIEKNENGLKILHHPIFTNKVDYISMYFDTSKVPQDKLGYMYLLENILGNIDTKNYSKEKLVYDILSNSGGINITDKTFTEFKDNDKYYPKMNVTILSLNNKLDKNFDIVRDIIFNSNLDDKKRLKEIINNTKQELEAGLMASEGSMAFQKVLSYISESGRYSDYKNEAFYNFMCDLDKNFDNKSDVIIKNLKDVRDLIFNKQDMITSYTGENSTYKNFVKAFSNFSKDLKDEKYEKQIYSFDNSNVNEGIMTPSKVQYVVKGGDLDRTGYKYSGKLQVLSNILESGYLWTNIRGKGGAYGANVSANRHNILFSSYRDPNLKETIKIIDQVPNYLSKFDADDREMTNYIIGTIGKLDNGVNSLSENLGPIANGIIGDGLYITHTKQEDIQREREDIINTTAKDIRDFAPLIEAILKEDYLCVVGGDTKIKENKENFVVIKDILNTKDKKNLTVSMDMKYNVPLNKSWDIKFSRNLDKITVNTSNVYVFDDKNHQVKINVNYDNLNKSIKISPIDTYEKGKKYTLFIKGIQSTKENGKIVKLLAPIKMEFVVK